MDGRSVKKDNIILTKSYEFALDIVDIYKVLCRQNFFEIAKQLLRSGTSIGANAEEATAGISKKDFIAKLQISYKEARETRFWLRLIRDSKIILINEISVLIEKCEELIRILNAILQSTKQNLANTN